MTQTKLERIRELEKAERKLEEAQEQVEEAIMEALSVLPTVSVDFVLSALQNAKIVLASSEQV